MLALDRSLPPSVRSAQSRLVRIAQRALLSTLAAALLLGCGGARAALTRGTLPAQETALLDLVPRDAFVAGRLDMSALRRTPHWEQILERLRSEEPTFADLASDIGHLYFAVGGLVQAPPIPPLVDEQRNYQPQPGWAQFARTFGGRIPKLVAIAEGGVARVCHQAAEGHAVEERAGYQVVDLDGVALLMRGESFCAMTWTPLVDALLAEAGPTADIASHLATADGGIVQLALQLDSPVVATLMADMPPPTLSDAELIVPEGMEGEERERYLTDVRAGEARAHRYSNFFRAVVRLVTHGLNAVSWQLSADAEAFETRTQVVIKDDGRMMMWRELTALQFDILREAVSYELLSNEEQALLAEFVRDVRIEEQRGGYQIIRHTRHDVIARMLRVSVPEPFTAFVEAVEDPDAVPELVLREQLRNGTNGTATQVIALVEPNIAFVREQPDIYLRGPVLAALASAYASQGRFEDAQALLVAERAYFLSVAVEDPQQPWRQSDARAWASQHAGALCETYVAQGFAERALTAADEDEPDQRVFEATACAAAALSLLGRVDEALARIEAGPSLPSSVTAYAAAQARVLLFGGRPQQALAVAAGVCVGGPAAESCATVAVLYAESLAEAAPSLSAAAPTFEALQRRYPSGSDQQLINERAANVQAADCALRVRLAASASETRASCALGLAHTLAAYGEGHPRVAAVRTSYGAALQAGRQRAEATQQREAAARIIATMGPQHTLRAATTGSRVRTR